MSDSRVGRPSHLLDKPRIARVLKWIQGGVFPAVAAQAEGIAKGSFYRWLQDAGNADRKFEEGLELTEYERLIREFRDSVTLAEAKAEASMTIEARAQARRQATAQGSVALLERRFAANWRYQSVSEVVGPGGGPLQVADLTDEEIENRLKRLADIAMEETRK